MDEPAQFIGEMSSKLSSSLNFRERIVTNFQNQKDFLTWWKNDFAPTVVATRKAIEPHIQKFQEISIALKKALTQFIEEHKETIEVWVKFAEIYPKLEPYIENITAGLDDPEFEVANDVVKMAHVFDAIDLDKEPEALSLMSVIAGRSFQESLIKFYKNLPLNQQRLNLIKEAFELHNNKYYGGSICLLYGLIEGVLTESFEKANYIVINSNRINPVDLDGNVNSRQNLRGLVQKLEHAISHQDQLSDYYEKIKSYELVNGDPQKTIPKTRNTILHGGSVDFNSEKRSAQLIMWLYSAILHLQALGFNNSIQPTDA